MKTMYSKSFASALIGLFALAGCHEPDAEGLVSIDAFDMTVEFADGTKLAHSVQEPTDVELLGGDCGQDGVHLLSTGSLTRASALIELPFVGTIDVDASTGAVVGDAYFRGGFGGWEAASGGWTTIASGEFEIVELSTETVRIEGNDVCLVDVLDGQPGSAEPPADCAVQDISLVVGKGLATSPMCGRQNSDTCGGVTERLPCPCYVETVDGWTVDASCESAPEDY